MNEKEVNWSAVNWSAVEQTLLDRLVDGELDAAGQRELLLRLENSPDGWRRCALAFVEAQAWGGELKALRGTANSHAAENGRGRGAGPEQGKAEKGNVEKSNVEKSKTEKGNFWRGPIGSVLGIAASFLVALALGLAWRSWDGVDRPDRSIAKLQPDAGNGGAGQPFVQGPGLQWATVPLPVKAASGETERMELPVAVGPDVDLEWLVNQPSLPPSLLRELERSGHRIEQVRQLVPFELEDGRRVIVPVDQIKVRYDGQRVIP